jgi:hypothetical protein
MHAIGYRQSKPARMDIVAACERWWKYVTGGQTTDEDTAYTPKKNSSGD